MMQPVAARVVVSPRGREAARVQKVQKVQRVQRGRYRPSGDEYIAAYRRHTTLPFELARSVGGTGAALGAEGA